jgi:hypothetical protein
VSSVERWEGLREGDIFSCSLVIALTVNHPRHKISLLKYKGI